MTESVSRILVALTPYILLVIGVIVAFIKLKTYVTEHFKTVEVQIEGIKEHVLKHEKILTSGKGGGSPFITDSEHDKLQEDCQTNIYSKIESIESNIGEMKNTMQKGDQCRTAAREETSNQFSALRTDMRVFQKEMFDIINPLVTKTAINELEIQYLKEKKEK